MSKIPDLAGDEFPQHTREQHAWLDRMNKDWTVAAVLTADPEGGQGEQPITVVLRTRTEERRYVVAPDGGETLIALLPRSAS